MDRLIVGLGNPGLKYHHTRHNIGWDVFEELSFAGGLKWQDKFKGHYAVYQNTNEKIYFLKPQTFMNLSGESVQPLILHYCNSCHAVSVSSGSPNICSNASFSYIPQDITTAQIVIRARESATMPFEFVRFFRHGRV